MSQKEKWHKEHGEVKPGHFLTFDSINSTEQRDSARIL